MRTSVGVGYFFWVDIARTYFLLFHSLSSAGERGAKGASKTAKHSAADALKQQPRHPCVFAISGRFKRKKDRKAIHSLGTNHSQSPASCAPWATVRQTSGGAGPDRRLFTRNARLERIEARRKFWAELQLISAQRR